MLSGPIKLYGYWRSSAAYRVRIALNLKGIEYDYVPVHLAKGEQRDPDFASLNPQHMVPVLLDGERVFRQSGAILQYLEDSQPDPALLPSMLRSRARVRALADVIGCDTHPLNNLRVLQYLETHGFSEDQRQQWYFHWLEQGFSAYEQLLSEGVTTGHFSEGDSPTLADIYLVPQVYNARRFKFDLKPFPQILKIYERCLALDAFYLARPEAQPDALHKQTA